jgi:hypothetical protein
MEVVFVMDRTDVVLDQTEAEALLPHLTDDPEAENAAERVRHALREGGDVFWTEDEKAAVYMVASRWEVDVGEDDGLMVLHDELMSDVASAEPS